MDRRTLERDNRKEIKLKNKNKNCIALIEERGV